MWAEVSLGFVISYALFYVLEMLKIEALCALCDVGIPILLPCSQLMVIHIFR